MGAILIVPLSDPTRLADPNRFQDTHLILFIYHFIKFSFSKMSQPESPARPEWQIRTRARFTLTFSFILSKNLFMSFHFRVFNYAEAFSNGSPINIFSYKIHLQNGVSCLYIMIYKTLVQSSTLLFTKYPMLKKEMTCIRRGIYLYAATYSMTLRFLILSSFLFTRNLLIDKNYALSIFMLSGSIKFYSNFQFNMTCIYHKTMPFISNNTHAFTFTCFHFTTH